MRDKRFSTSQQVLFLLQSAYKGFKKRYPDEEPYWKIYCHRKIRKTTTVSEADLNSDWRQRFTDMSDNSIDQSIEIKAEVQETIKHKSILEIKSNVNDKQIKIKECKPKIISETVIELKEETALTDVHPSDCDLVCFIDEVSSINHIPLIEMEDKLLGLKKELNKLRDSVIDFKNHVMNEESIEQINEKMNSTSKLMSEIKMVAGKDKTIDDILKKYLEIQHKLRNLKSVVLPILRKHSRLRIDDILKGKTFIQSLEDAIKYFDADYESEDDYDENG